MSIPRPVVGVLFLVLFFACKQKPQQDISPVKKITVDTNNIVSTPQPEKSLNPFSNIDVSPMDMSYFPIDFPKLKMAKGTVLSSPVLRIIYSRPHLGKRRFHDILKYNEPWRLGANESTEIDFFKSVTIQGKKVTPGRYIIYCIPYADKWTVILNSNIDTWGLKQETDKDVYKFEIPVTHNNPPLEYFTMVFEKTEKGANLIMAWDDLIARLPINL